MFKNKLVTITVIILLSLTSVAAIALLVVNKFASTEVASEGPTVDEIIELSVDTEEITTNLLTSEYVKIKLKIQVDNKDAKEELEKRNFQVNNTLIHELAGMKASEFAGSEGLAQLEDRLKTRIADFLEEGSVIRVYITSIIIQ